jgi:cobalt transporter subunit CbtA
MIARVLLAAVIAGMIAGAAATALQMWRVVPLILQAETYENAEPGAGHAHAAPTEAQTPHAHAADEAAEPWAPEDGLERTLYTLLSNVVMGVAFGFLLAAAVMFTGRPITPGNGAVWGLMGFIVFTLAPNAGLPPELPGMPAADLAARQAWWAGTVAATAGGIALLALAPRVPLKGLGAVLIAVPHLIGAPLPKSHESAVPATLAAQFTASTMVSMALFWIILGIASGWLLSRAQITAEA